MDKTATTTTSILMAVSRRIWVSQFSLSSSIRDVVRVSGPPFYHPTNIVKELRKLSALTPNQGESSMGFMLSSSTTGLLKEESLLFPCQLWFNIIVVVGVVVATLSTFDTV